MNSDSVHRRPLMRDHATIAGEYTLYSVAEIILDEEEDNVRRDNHPL